MNYSFAFIGELLKKGKRFAVSYIVADCLTNKDPDNAVLLHHVAEYLLNPTEKINKPDVIEWIRWLLGAGKNPDEFTKEGKRETNLMIKNKLSIILFPKNSC